MTRRWRTRVATASALVASLAVAGAGPATARPYERSLTTSAIVVNHVDDRTRTAFDLDVMRTSAAHVGAHNVAYAESTCTGCTSAAVSVQIVLSGRGAESLHADNRAVALNVNCTGCTTTAVALQFVVAVGDKLGLTGAGRSALAGIERDLRRAIAADPTPDAVNLVSQQAASRISAVLQTELRTKPLVGKRIDVARG